MRPPRAAQALAGMICSVEALALAQVAHDEPPAASPADTTTPPASAPPAQAHEGDDGWPDLSGFLDEKYGFLPIAMPVTEPAVGYGIAGGLAFLSKSLGQVNDGLGRPNITFVGGMGTENGSWGAFAGDSRYWLEDHLQTLTGFVYASVNLDFHGIGSDSRLQDNPLRYNLEPKAGALIGKYRFGASSWWAGLGYAFASTKVSFEAAAETPGLPDFQRVSNTGALLPSLVLDTRSNIFTPLSGLYLEASAAIATKWLGSDDDFQRAGLLALSYVPLPQRFFLGLRAEADASFGDAPFYLRPYVGLRGVPIMRYQGEEVVALEGELRWQFWERWSMLGFGGAGSAWNDFEKFEDRQGVVAGGAGFRYELARKYGIHMGVDVAFSRDTTAFYLQVGNAWMRP